MRSFQRKGDGSLACQAAISVSLTDNKGRQTLNSSKANTLILGVNRLYQPRCPRWLLWIDMDTIQLLAWQKVVTLIHGNQADKINYLQAEWFLGFVTFQGTSCHQHKVHTYCFHICGDCHSSGLCKDLVISNWSFTLELDLMFPSRITTIMCI